jgi:Probable cobalt transporter subunit (CbtB)
MRAASQIFSFPFRPNDGDAGSPKEAGPRGYTHHPQSLPTPVVVPVSRAMLWLAGAAILALAIYYFIGVDEGATSVFGNSMVIHEFVHDSRHFLGFPCH